MVQHMKSGSLMIQILLSRECKSKIIYTMLRVIWLTLSKNVVHNVAKEKSTVELMKVLLDMYEKLSANNKVFLIKKLFHLKMEEGVSMATHLNEFNMIVNQLSELELCLEGKEKDKAFPCHTMAPKTDYHLVSFICPVSALIHFSLAEKCKEGEKNSHSRKCRKLS